jgi:hypothetical protein
MKLVTYEMYGKSKVGVLEDDYVIDIRKTRKHQLVSLGLSVKKSMSQAYCEIPDSMTLFIEGGENTLKIAEECVTYAKRNRKLGEIIHPLVEVKLRAPKRLS